MSYQVDSYHVQKSDDEDGYVVLMFSGSNVIDVAGGTESECYKIGKEAVKNGTASSVV